MLVVFLAAAGAAPLVVNHILRAWAPGEGTQGAAANARENSAASRPTNAPASPPADVPPGSPTREPAEPAPPGFADTAPPGATAPLVSDESLRWAEANSFERFDAREKLAEGEANYFGRGVPVDFARARACFEVAARHEGRAALYLADIYERGLGVAQDYRVSVSWLERSVALGDPEAQFRLGSLCLEGRPGLVALDPPRGLQLLNAAAGQGHAGAQATLARLAPR